MLLWCSSSLPLRATHIASGAQRCRRRGMQRTMNNHPGGRLAAREPWRSAFRQSLACESFRRLNHTGITRVRPAVDHRNGYRPEERGPEPPRRERRQVVGADDPDQPMPPKASLEPGDRIDRVASAEAALYIAHVESAVSRRGPRGGEALVERRHPGPGLERILRRDQPPDLVQAQALERQQADVAVALMGGIEGAAEQADLAPRRPRARSAFRYRPRPSPAHRHESGQGRTCPLP